MNLDNPRYFFLFFVLVWVVVGFVVAQIGGWGPLARFYRLNNPFTGERWYFRSGRKRLTMRYDSCLTIGANAEGLYLAVLFLFRFGHPPLFIPWQDIAVRTGKTLWWRWTEFRFRQAPGVFLRVFGQIGDDVKSVAGQFWPVENLTAQNHF